MLTSVKTREMSFFSLELHMGKTRVGYSSCSIQPFERDHILSVKQQLRMYKISRARQSSGGRLKFLRSEYTFKRLQGPCREGCYG